MKAKHTQGPWEFVNSNTALVGPKIDDKPIWLRPVVLRSETGIRAEDASLIAAAPELLWALELLVAGIENSVSDTYIPLAKAREAIAKASPHSTGCNP